MTGYKHLLDYPEPPKLPSRVDDDLVLSGALVIRDSEVLIVGVRCLSSFRGPIDGTQHVRYASVGRNREILGC